MPLDDADDPLPIEIMRGQRETPYIRSRMDWIENTTRSVAPIGVYEFGRTRRTLQSPTPTTRFSGKKA